MSGTVVALVPSWPWWAWIPVAAWVVFAVVLWFAVFTDD